MMLPEDLARLLQGGAPNPVDAWSRTRPLYDQQFNPIRPETPGKFLFDGPDAGVGRGSAPGSLVHNVGDVIYPDPSRFVKPIVPGMPGSPGLEGPSPVAPPPPGGFEPAATADRAGFASRFGSRAPQVTEGPRTKAAIDASPNVVRMPKRPITDDEINAAFDKAWGVGPVEGATPKELTEFAKTLKQQTDIATQKRAMEERDAAWRKLNNAEFDKLPENSVGKTVVREAERGDVLKQPTPGDTAQTSFPGTSQGFRKTMDDIHSGRDPESIARQLKGGIDPNQINKMVPMDQRGSQLEQLRPDVVKQQSAELNLLRRIQKLGVDPSRVEGALPLLMEKMSPEQIMHFIAVQLQKGNLTKLPEGDY